MYLINICPTGLERQLLKVVYIRRSLAIGNMGSGMVSGKDVTING
jgi:hypothetical protein